MFEYRKLKVIYRGIVKKTPQYIRKDFDFGSRVPSSHSMVMNVFIVRSAIPEASIIVLEQAMQ